ncbi:putative 4-hydroxy-4-methyl-2-oxoglutarate aldolase 3 [Drosera capensis]
MEAMDAAAADVGTFEKLHWIDNTFPVGECCTFKFAHPRHPECYHNTKVRLEQDKTVVEIEATLNVHHPAISRKTKSDKKNQGAATSNDHKIEHGSVSFPESGITSFPPITFQSVLISVQVEAEKQGNGCLLVSPIQFTHLQHLLARYPLHALRPPRLLLSPLQDQGYRRAGSTGNIMAGMATAEICDSNADLLKDGEVRVLHPIFHIYGQRRAFSGRIVTVKVFEDNVIVRELIESEGDGRVLVIDGGGSMRCALLGGNLGQIAQNMGWSGVVVNGCIRDVCEINSCDIGVRALGSHPLKSNKKGIGEKHCPIYVAGALIHDGEWLYADADGILISKCGLTV